MQRRPQAIVSRPITALIVAAAAIGPGCAGPPADTPDGGGITSGAGGGAGARAGDGGGTQTGGGGSADTAGGPRGAAGASGRGGGGDAGGSGASGGGGAGAGGTAGGAGASGGASGAGASGGRGGTGGSGAAIRGASLNIGSSQQVVLRNLRIHDVKPHLVEAGDGITIQGAKHIWLDHLRVQEISDGYVDIGTTTTSTTIDDNITVSFVHFDGRTAWLCGGQHSYVSFADNAHVTYHHNWFDSGNGRNPKIGGANAQVHLFNNYWLAIGYFCITAQVDAQARVESNYFENASRPHWLQLDGNGRAGIAIDSGNVYTGASSGNTNRDTGGAVFSVPYAYTKETAATARTQTMKCAGPQPIR